MPSIRIEDPAFWEKVGQLINLVNNSDRISLDRVMEIFPGIGGECLEEIREKRHSPLVLDNGYFEQTGDPVQCDFQANVFNVRVRINKELMGTYHKSAEGFRFKFYNSPRTIDILRPWGSHLEVLQVTPNEIFIDNAGGMMDIVLHK